MIRYGIAIKDEDGRWYLMPRLYHDAKGRDVVLNSRQKRHGYMHYQSIAVELKNAD